MFGEIGKVIPFYFGGKRMLQEFEMMYYELGFFENQ